MHQYKDSSFKAYTSKEYTKLKAKADNDMLDVLCELHEDLSSKPS